MRTSVYVFRDIFFKRSIIIVSFRDSVAIWFFLFQIQLRITMTSSFFSFSIIKDFYYTWHTQKTYPTAINIANVRLKPTSCIRNNKIYCIFLRPWFALYFFLFFFFLCLFIGYLRLEFIYIRNKNPRFKNIKNEHRMERRKTEATGGNWPRIDILCKHVENVYIGGKRIAWKIEVTSGWKNNEGFLISRTPSQSCESKKIGTFENL